MRSFVCVCVKNVVLHVWIYLNNRCNAWCCYEWQNFRFLRPKRGKFFPIPSLSGQYKNFNISILTYKCQHSFQAMRTSACFCITGWLAVFFSKVFNFTHTYIPTYTEISMDLDLNVMLQSFNKKIWCYNVVQGALLLDVGRFFTGYGIGVFSYVVITLFFLLDKSNNPWKQFFFI